MIWWIYFYSFHIGIYHSFTGGKQRTTNEYLRGGNTISVLPATLSLTVSFVSSIMLIGWPAETYEFGGQFFLSGFGFALGYFLSAYIYVPVFYPLGTTTSNEVASIVCSSWFYVQRGRSISLYIILHLYNKISNSHPFDKILHL